jgi:hypothetical protein
MAAHPTAAPTAVLHQPHLRGALAFVPLTRPRRQHCVGTRISPMPAGSQTPSRPALAVLADLRRALSSPCPRISLSRGWTRISLSRGWTQISPTPAGSQPRHALPRPRTGRLRRRLRPPSTSPLRVPHAMGWCLWYVLQSSSPSRLLAVLRES